MFLGFHCYKPDENKTFFRHGPFSPCPLSLGQMFLIFSFYSINIMRLASDEHLFGILSNIICSVENTSC